MDGIDHFNGFGDCQEVPIQARVLSGGVLQLIVC